MNMKKTLLFALCTMLLTVNLPANARSKGHRHSNRVVVYFTRHAEKKTTTEVVVDVTSGRKTIEEVCGVKKCAEELNALGLMRAELMADWFERKRITSRLTHAFSSHKKRTLQTILPTVNRAIEAGAILAPDLDNGIDNDPNASSDGVQEIPFNMDSNDLNAESTSGSIQGLVDELQSLEPGSVVLAAGHSGTLYKIMGDGDPEKGITGLGIDTSSDIDFPRNSKGKVRDFGDIWKVVINTRSGKARLAWRKNLEFGRLRVKRKVNDIDYPKALR